ncbi:MAG: DUF3077 domain-containing protein [Pseudomonas sp.]|nr:DUF3077 domain-containing protein [Pseudomonas sp.]
MLVFFAGLLIMSEFLETTALAFGMRDSQQQPFFSVNAGISLEDALCHLGHLLKCAYDSAYELTDGDGLEKGLVWSTLHHIEGAKGLVDALIAVR